MCLFVVSLPWSCYARNRHVVTTESQLCGWQDRKVQPSEASVAEACLGRWVEEKAQEHRD